MIDLFGVVGDSAVHDGSASRPFNQIALDQVTRTEIVSPPWRLIACLSSRNWNETWFHWTNFEKAPL